MQICAQDFSIKTRTYLFSGCQQSFNICTAFNVQILLVAMSIIMENIRETLEIQINELEALQSVYPKELTISNHGNLADINDFIAGNTIVKPLQLKYEIEILLDEGTVEFLVDLPLEYPNVLPQIYCRSSALDREEQVNINKDLELFCESQERGDPIIYVLVDWIQDNADSYFKRAAKNRRKKNYKQDPKESLDKKVCNEFARYWIYSHHIYNTEKRKAILDWAKENSLTGFSFIGKPGVICVEGVLDDCEYYWQKLKHMNWHRIVVKFIEKDYDPIDDLNVYRKFTDFEELCFANCDRTTGHTSTLNFKNDTSQFLKYLIKHDLEHAFKELFGIDAKCTE